eukprot:6883712-Prymnesium_polylepis.1
MPTSYASLTSLTPRLSRRHRSRSAVASMMPMTMVVLPGCPAQQQQQVSTTVTGCSAASPCH